MFSVTVSAINNYMTVDTLDKDEAEDIALNFAREDLPDADAYEVTNVIEVK